MFNRVALKINQNTLKITAIFFCAGFLFLGLAARAEAGDNKFFKS